MNGEFAISLDPDNWDALRTQAHRMLDDMFDHLASITERPLWQHLPADARHTQFRQPLPHAPQALENVHAEFMQHILPYTLGNIHPGFMGWVHGGGTPVGMVAEMLAAGINANLGGRDHAPIEVERQITHWMRELFGFPAAASGLFVTGTSMANLIAVIIAKTCALGAETRHAGLGEAGIRLRAYTSTDAHNCISKAMAVVGLGSDALRRIGVDADHRMNLAELAATVAADRAAGYVPFLVVGTAGSVNVGAIDDLNALADFAHTEGLWLHVDGAFGALARLSPEIAPQLDGIERVDSIAFDFHKWGQVPYDAGFVLVRDGELHRRAFAENADYLQNHEHGMAAGAPWPCDFGPDLSRGFRALKTWFTLKTYGADALGNVISSSCRLAQQLAARIDAEAELERLAPVALNIVCFRYVAPTLDAEATNALNTRLVIDLQEAGRVAPSSTRIRGQVAIRAALVNHRTSEADIEALIDATLHQGRLRLAALSPSLPPTA